MGDLNSMVLDTLTHDSILGGKIQVFQEKDGYRFSLDAVLLPHFVECAPESVIVDLGSGAGVIPLILATLNPTSTIYGLEVQDSLARLAKHNVEENKMGDRVTIVQHDLRNLPVPGCPKKVDWVVSNPPYRRLGSGRVNPQSQKAVARHEIMANLNDVIQAASRLLDRGGRFAVVYPSTRLADLIHGLKEHGLEPKRMRLVHSNTSSPARLVLVEAIKGGGAQLTVEKPLYIYKDNNAYTREVQDMLYPD